MENTMGLNDLDKDETYERQKLLAGRLYQKLDHQKSNRIKIPVVVAIGNFSLLKLFEDEKDFYVVIGVIVTMTIIGFVGLGALRTIRIFFRKNVDDLEYLYEKMGMKTKSFMSDPNERLAEPADPFWLWLDRLVFLCWFIPTSLALIPIVLKQSNLTNWFCGL